MGLPSCVISLGVVQLWLRARITRSRWRDPLTIAGPSFSVFSYFIIGTEVETFPRHDQVTKDYTIPYTTIDYTMASNSVQNWVGTLGNRMDICVQVSSESWLLLVLLLLATGWNNISHHVRSESDLISGSARTLPLFDMRPVAPLGSQSIYHADSRSSW